MITQLPLLLLLAAVPQAGAQTVAASTAAAVLTVEQVYRPLNQRDPLLPATVYGDSKGGNKPQAPAPAPAAAVKPSAMPAPEAASSSFSVYGLALTGILEDYRGKQALLRDAAAGILYTLRGGRLYDAKKKAVPGVSGVVKGRQVVLMTEDKKVHQLSLKEKESQSQVAE